MMTDNSPPCAWLEATVKAIVDDPSAVRVVEVDGAQASIIEITVAPVDIKRLIGRKGTTADGIRALLRAIGGKNGRKYHLEIVEPTHRADEIPGSAGLGVPVKVERVFGHDLRLSVEHGD